MPVLDGVTSIRVGVDAVDRVYVGSTLIWTRTVGGALSLRSTDSSAAVDTARVSAAQVSDGDVATSAETEAVDQAGQSVAGSDTATIVEGTSTYVQVADADTATSNDVATVGVQDQAKADADTSGGVVEGQAVVVTLPAQADTATVVENATVVQQASAIVERTATVAENNGGSSVQGNVGNAQNGDFMLCFGTAADAISISSGWTPLFTPTTYAGNGYGVWYRRKTGQAADVPTLTGGSSGRMAAIIGAYGGVHATTPFDVALALDTSEGGTTLTLPAITTVTANALVLIHCAVDATNADFTLSGPHASYPQDVQTTGQGRRQALASGVKATAGATPSFTWSQASGLALMMIGCTLALRPA